MRKWMRDRMKRRKKPGISPETTTGQEAPAPLQPTFLDRTDNTYVRAPENAPAAIPMEAHEPQPVFESQPEHELPSEEASWRRCAVAKRRSWWSAPRTQSSSRTPWTWNETGSATDPKPVPHVFPAWKSYWRGCRNRARWLGLPETPSAACKPTSRGAIQPSQEAQGCSRACHRPARLR